MKGLQNNQKNIIERILYYWGRIYTRQIKEGEEYKRLEKTIIILITDFKIKSLEKSEYHTKWKIIEEKDRKIILTDKLELHIISLEKMRENEGRKMQDELLDWLYFLENPKSERVKEKEKIPLEVIIRITGLTKEEIMN